MKIKYHDNFKEPKYVDHKLVDNWDPDGDYKEDEYTSVHFRIETYDFDDPHGIFKTTKGKEDFDKEKIDVFKSLGWHIKSEAYCMDVVNGNETLYLHPQDFSGIVLKRNVKKIAEALKKNNTFEIRWVDIYDTVYDITDEEYEKYLETRRDYTRKILFLGGKTKRTNKYYFKSSLVDPIARQIRLPRIGCRSVYDPNKGAIDFVNKCIYEMVKEGYLVEAKDDRYEYIRSRNKTEMKKLKLKEL